MAMYYPDPYRPYWGPFVDPAPWADGNYPWGGPPRWWGGGGPAVDPAPFPMGPAYPRLGYQPSAAEAAGYPLAGPWFTPAPYLPPYADPAPDWWRWNAQPGRRPITIADPPPDDIRYRVDRFRDYLVGIFRDAGISPEAANAATVGDLLEAFKAAQMPPEARTAMTGMAGMTVARVSSLDVNALESLRLQLESERQRIEVLSKAVEDRLKAPKGEARK